MEVHSHITGNKVSRTAFFGMVTQLTDPLVRVEVETSAFGFFTFAGRVTLQGIWGGEILVHVISEHVANSRGVALGFCGGSREDDGKPRDHGKFDGRIHNDLGREGLLLKESKFFINYSRFSVMSWWIFVLFAVWFCFCAVIMTEFVFSLVKILVFFLVWLSYIVRRYV